VDAAYNYWGDPNGPKYTSERNLDMRDEVYGNVIYEPWLTEPVLDTAPPYLGIETVYVRHYIKGRGEVLIELEVSDVMYVGGKKEWYSFVRIVTDNLYGAPALRDIELYVDGELYSHYNVSSKHFMWPRWPLKWRIYEHDYEDGTEHIVEIVLRDKIGVEARKELHFIIDNSPPSLVKLHVSRTYIRKGGIIEVRQSSYDEHSQIRMVKLFVNETLLCLWTQENETVPFLWNTSDLSEGHYELKLTAINRAWLESSTSLLIGIDMSPPIISSINYPQHKKPVEGHALQIGVEAMDNISFVQRVILWFRVDSSAWSSIEMRMVGWHVRGVWNSSYWRAIIQIPFGVSSLEFYVEVYDAAGNLAVSEMYHWEVVPFYIHYLPLFVILGIFIAISTALWIKGRRG